MSLRDELRQVIRNSGEPPVEEVPWSKRVVAYLKGMQDYEVERNTAQALAEMQGATPPPQSLPEQLKQLIGEQEPSDQLPLNGDALLAAAGHAVGGSGRSTADSIAALLRHQLSEDDPITGRMDHSG